MAMIDVSGKAEIFREATASGTITLRRKRLNASVKKKSSKATHYTPLKSQAYWRRKKPAN